jgi:hypothetical protein
MLYVTQLLYIMYKGAMYIYCKFGEIPWKNVRKNDPF